MNRPTRRLRALAASAHTLLQTGPGPLGTPTQAEMNRIAPLVVRALNEQTAGNPAATERRFNDPPIFPYDIELDDSNNPESPYNFTKATLHIDDTKTPAKTFALEEQPVLRRGGDPNNCPCTAIYSNCRCPVRL